MIREDLVRALDQRIRGFAESGDASPVLEESATGQARQLADVIASADGASRVDVEAQRTLGRLYCCRFQALPKGAGQAALAAALEFFSPIAQVARTRSPTLSGRASPRPA